MALTFADVVAEAQALLNDVAGEIWTTAILLPYGKKAVRELWEQSLVAGMPLFNEISSVLTLAANVTSLHSGSTPALPSDLVLPIKLEERPGGSSSSILFEDMDEREWDVDTTPGPTLDFWVWREGEIKLVGATTSRDVRIQYLKAVTEPTGGASQLEVQSTTKTFLGARTAGLACVMIGENMTRGEALTQDADKAMHRFLQLATKARQNLRTRRLPYRGSRRFRRFGF